MRAHLTGRVAHKKENINGVKKGHFKARKKNGLSYGLVDKVSIFTSHHFKECFNLLSI